MKEEFYVKFAPEVEYKIQRNFLLTFEGDEIIDCFIINTEEEAKKYDAPIRSMIFKIKLNK